MCALEVLEKECYNPSLPLENFLYTHIKNRFVNLHRDKLRRRDAPCRACHEGKPCDQGSNCSKYAAWLKRNTAKANLMRPLDLAHISDEREPHTRLASTVTEDAEIDEMLQLVDKHLPVELRSTYLQMRDGVSVSRAKRNEVEQRVREILRGALECQQNEDD
jgi:hypothetical protein